jgi:aspartyl-tRNA(Asn)/glutamyl-tRNA(Gln) amidotransferase subunit A
VADLPARRIEPIVTDTHSEHPDGSHRARIARCLAAIDAPQGEGARTFTRVYPEAAMAAADAADRAAALGLDALPLAGLAVSIKDLFEVKGEPTRSGAAIGRDFPPAVADALIVRRLRAAGAAIVGKTTMTEFAFSGLGINPHDGTPANPWRRSEKRIPGGSSSGAAVSVTDGMADAAIGTDTGGSVRIPAALCGLVGFKPTSRNVPLDGAFPLSQSYDSIGPLARDVDTCARVNDVLSGQPLRPVTPQAARSITIAAISNYVLDGLEPEIAGAYERALKRLSAAGMQVREVHFDVLDDLPALFVGGGLVAAEAYAVHRALIEKSGPHYDPRVLVRMLRGKDISAANYIALLQLRGALIARWERECADVDCVAMPTVPVAPPRIADLADDAAYGTTNLLILRNPTLVNALDGCAISLPCHVPSDAPAGLMLAAPGGSDTALLRIAKTAEQFLSRR